MCSHQPKAQQSTPKSAASVTGDGIHDSAIHALRTKWKMCLKKKKRAKSQITGVILGGGGWIVTKNSVHFHTSNGHQSWCIESVLERSSAQRGSLGALDVPSLPRQCKWPYLPQCVSAAWLPLSPADPRSSFHWEDGEVFHYYGPGRTLKSSLFTPSFFPQKVQVNDT